MWKSLQKLRVILFVDEKIPEIKYIIHTAYRISRSPIEMKATLILIKILRFMLIKIHCFMLIKILRFMVIKILRFMLIKIPCFLLIKILHYVNSVKMYYEDMKENYSWKTLSFYFPPFRTPKKFKNRKRSLTFVSVRSFKYINFLWLFRLFVCIYIHI